MGVKARHALSTQCRAGFLQMIYSKRENAVSSKCPRFVIFISRTVHKLSQRNSCATYVAASVLDCGRGRLLDSGHGRHFGLVGQRLRLAFERKF
jgi:hypothetical protein